MGMPKEEPEEYLEAILDTSEKEGSAKTTALSRKLGVAPASVTEALQRLSRAGFVRYRPYRGATLTEKGRAAASKVKRRHRLLEVFLTRFLKLDHELVHDEACRMEHALSDRTERALCKSLGAPRTCPGGHPIPPCDDPAPSCSACEVAKGPRAGKRSAPVPLPSLSVRETGEVASMRGGSSLVRRLHDLGLTPGTPVSLVRSAPLKGPVEVCVRGCNLALGREIAEKILVTRKGTSA